MKVTRRMLVAAMLAGVIAAPAHTQPSLKLSWEQIREVPNNLVLRLQNPGSTAVCVPDVEVKESISFSQFGRKVDPFYYHNRAILQWRGADLISGMIVVPPGRRIDVFFDLNEWMLKRGKATASINVPAYDCLVFFQKASPRPVRLHSQFSVSAPLSVAPKN
jgi:hypothetical protein